MSNILDIILGLQSYTDSYDFNNDNAIDIYDIVSFISGPRKILCLHGGGGNANSFRNQAGMQDLITEFQGQYEFIFVSAPNNGVWLVDGKENYPVNDSQNAEHSVSVIQAFLDENGPFYGILGYSQGVAMALIYLSKTLTRFDLVLLFNGYFPVYNTDLVQIMNNVKPLSYRTMIFTATNDYGFYSTSLDIHQNNYFQESTLIVSSTAGHALPTNGSDKYSDVVNFIN